MWKELIQSFDEKADVRFNEPALPADLQAVEKALAVRLPGELCDYLAESDGDDSLMLPVEEVANVNLKLREEAAGQWMPLDCLLFVAGNGSGDYYGYAVIDRQPVPGKLYYWCRETDDRVLVAGGLQELMERYYRGEI